MGFEHYIQAGGRRLRCGFTTGTCAALASCAAAERLLGGAWPDSVSLVTPKGIAVEVAPEECRVSADGAAASCGVRKDAGDDVDCTAGALVVAHVAPCATPGVRIEGGAGVGRVTKPGLDQPVGAAAINRVPRAMIERALGAVAEAADYAGGFDVVVSVPGGAELAARTFNPQLGIEGGISILGTSGIVEPMSVQALASTVEVELRQRAAEGHRRVILTPGNYGVDFLAASGLDEGGAPVVKIGNFVGVSLDAAVAGGFEKILLVGHVGKLVKVAGGIMDTHSRTADCRAELFCAHAAVLGADAATCRALMAAPTADACLAVLEGARLRGPVVASLLAAIQRQLERRAALAARARPDAPPPGAPGPLVGAVMFSNEYGELGRTQTVQEVLA